MCEEGQPPTKCIRHGGTDDFNFYIRCAATPYTQALAVRTLHLKQFKMDKNFPMIGPEANAPGNYEIISRTNNTVINPGGIIVVDIMITGYGKITQSKIAFYPSGEILDIANSKVFFDLGKVDNMVVWGVNEQKIKNEGVTIGLSGAGLRHENWPNQTMFFDLSTGSTPIISTESIMHARKPPFQFELRTNKKIRSGNYELHFSFTYFNGTEWKSSNLTVGFTIRNIFQRHESMISWIAFGATIVSIVSAIYTIMDFYK